MFTTSFHKYENSPEAAYEAQVSEPSGERSMIRVDDSPMEEYGMISDNPFFGGSNDLALDLLEKEAMQIEADS